MRGLGLGRGFSLRKTTHTAGNPIVTSTWVGGGSTNNFSDAANWDVAPSNNGILIFAGSTRLAPNNDTTGLAISQVVFSAGAGAFTVSGTEITNPTSIVNNSSNVQQINNNISTTANMTVNTNSQDIKLTNIIDGTGKLIKTGTYALRMYSTNIYSGGTDLIAGELAANADNILGTGTLTTSNGATLSSTNGASNRFDCAIVLNGTLNIPAYFGGGGDYRFYGVISGSGSINVVSDGNGRRLEFHAVNTFTGGITLGVGNQNVRGKLEAFNNNAFGTGPISWNQNGAYIGIYDGGVGPYTLPNAITIPSGATLTIALRASVDLTGVISGGGNLLVSNGGFGSGTCLITQDMTLGGYVSVLSNGIQVSFNGNVTCGVFTSSAFHTQVTGSVASADFSDTVHMNVGIDSLANIGVLNVTGNAIFNSANEITESVAGGTALSQIVVGGTCALGGVTINFSGALDAGTYTIMSSTGAMSGTAAQGSAPTGRTWVSLMVVSNNLVAVFT